jgi:predicted DNA-binding transcriptional regulator YafY
MFGGKEERVRFWWHEDYAGAFYDRFGTDTVVQQEENGFTASVSVVVSPLFHSFLMGFGDGVKILSPEWVKEDYCRHARRALANYREEEMQ